MAYPDRSRDRHDTGPPGGAPCAASREPCRARAVVARPGGLWQIAAMSLRKAVIWSRRAATLSPRRLAAVAVALLVAGALHAPASAKETFDRWLAELRAEALRAGTSAATLDTALAGLAPIPEVIEKDRTQPEFTMTFSDY